MFYVLDLYVFVFLLGIYFSVLFAPKMVQFKL